MCLPCGQTKRDSEVEQVPFLHQTKIQLRWVFLRVLPREAIAIEKNQLIIEISCSIYKSIMVVLFLFLCYTFDYD